LTGELLSREPTRLTLNDRLSDHEKTLNDGIDYFVTRLFKQADVDNRNRRQTFQNTDMIILVVH